MRSLLDHFVGSADVVERGSCRAEADWAGECLARREARPTGRLQSPVSSRQRRDTFAEGCLHTGKTRHETEIRKIPL